MESLKTQLHRVLQARGSLTTYELEALCKRLGYKMSNAERRLRFSESPEVIRIKNGKAIIAYQWGLSD